MFMQYDLCSSTGRRSSNNKSYYKDNIIVLNDTLKKSNKCCYKDNIEILN